MKEEPDHNNEELLEIYLSLPKERRDARFADTARAAELVGISQRTIQLWAEKDKIRAIYIGGKLKVDLNSVKAHLIHTVSSNSGKKRKDIP